MKTASLDVIAAAALSSRETLQASHDLAMNCYANGVPGDFVECGVFGGAQAAAMASAIMRMKKIHASLERPDCVLPSLPPRRVHLFDSFQGIPQGGPHDEDWPHPVGTSACSLEDVKRNMAQWGIDEDLLVYHKGWFYRTVALFLRGDPIAILRLDADLYESTRICLEYLYPLLSPGGWVIVDDFALPGCRKAVDDYMRGKYPPIYFQKERA